MVILRPWKHLNSPIHDIAHISHTHFTDEDTYFLCIAGVQMESVCQQKQTVSP